MVQAITLVGVAAVLVIAAISDIRSRRIPNILSIIICGLFAIFAATQMLDGADWLDALVYPTAVGVAVFVLGAILFALGMMGGGDVKLMGATALFAGPLLSIKFVLYTTILGGFVALGTVLFAKLAKKSDKKSNQVPYGVAISASGLWVMYQNLAKIAF